MIPSLSLLFMDIKKIALSLLMVFASSASGVHSGIMTSNTVSDIPSQTKIIRATASGTPAGIEKNNPEIKKDWNKPFPILMYHHVRIYNNPHDPIGVNLSVSPKNFIAQLDYLKKSGYTTVTFDDLDNGVIPRKPIVLTFDDGYDNFYTNVFPELKKRGMTAVSFIIVNRVNQKGYMTANEIKKISENGVEIGCHTWTHPDLKESKDLNKEIIQSKKTLEKMFNLHIVSFSYPSGEYNARVLNEVKKAGFEYAVTTHYGVANTKNNLTLPRIRISPGTNLKRLLEKAGVK